MQRGPLLHRTQKGAAPAPPLGGADPVIRTPPGLPFQNGLGKKCPGKFRDDRELPGIFSGVYPQAHRAENELFTSAGAGAIRCDAMKSPRTHHNGFVPYGLTATRCAGLAVAPGLGLWLYPQSEALWVGSIPRRAGLFMGSQ